MIRVRFFKILIIMSFNFLLAFSGQVNSVDTIAPAIGYQELQSISLTAAELKNPRQFVFDGKYFYVVDDFAGMVFKFDQEGDLIAKLKQVEGLYIDPMGIALEYDYLYITDRAGGRIIKFSKDLALENSYFLNLAAGSDRYFSEPLGLTIDQYRDLYVVDADLNLIVKVNSLGVVEWRQGRFGNAREALNTPVDVAVDQYLNVYVADAGNKRIKVYDQNGEILYLVNELEDPQGICVDNKRPDFFYVADTLKQSVFFYQRDVLRGVIKFFAGRAIFPQDVFKAADKLYVLDSRQKKIFVYAIN